MPTPRDRPAGSGQPPNEAGLGDTVFYRYHCETKHTPAKLRSDPWFLDWANQPDPFRHYDGGVKIALPRPRRPEPCDYFTLADAVAGSPVCLQTVSQLLYYSMAISAVKELTGRGVRWSLRVNPSSGNLHPTDTHLILRGVGGLPDGCYHFSVDTFQLEARYQGNVDDMIAALHGHCALPMRGVTVVLTSIFWREAWKYRSRAFRYCHHDMGHAVGAMTECARGLGLACTLRHVFDDVVIAEMMGLQGGDEVVCALLAIGPACEGIDGEVQVASREFAAAPNRLSTESIAFPSIDAVYQATRHCTRSHVQPRCRVHYDVAQADRVQLPVPSWSGDGDACRADDFWDIVRRRRSGVDFDGETGISRASLSAMLYRATQGVDGDVGCSPSGRGAGFLVHPYLYVHRVSGVEPGVYYYDRGRHALVRLHGGDVRREAMYLSLGQSIAANSAFAMSMVADLAEAWRVYGERGYRAAHIESGIIGQGLYLGAEACGTNATGIGAFFDDDVNRYLRLPRGLEVVYHFTVGRSVDDPRLRTGRAYGFE